MAILKLEPGQKALFTIASIEDVEGNFGPQWKFTATNGDAMFLNVDTAERQLSRIGYSRAAVIGQTVEFERIQKGAQKFTNINKPGDAKLAASTEKQSFSAGPLVPGMDDQDRVVVPPTAVVNRLEGLFNLYGVCLDQAIVQAKKLDKAEIGHSPEAVASMCATMFIAAKDKGLAA
jgi:hypothetical protein